MINKTYSSFEEIDNEIRLLRLEKEIDKLSFKQQVSDSVDSLTPKNLLANTWAVSYTHLTLPTKLEV